MRSKRLKRSSQDTLLSVDNDIIQPSVDDEPSINLDDSLSSPATGLGRKAKRNCRYQSSSPEKNDSSQVSNVIECSDESKDQSKDVESQVETPKKQSKRLLRFRNNSTSPTASATTVKSSSHPPSSDPPVTSIASDQMTKTSDLKAITNVNSHSSSSSENKSNISYSRSNRTIDAASKANVINSNTASAASKAKITYLSMPKSTLTLTSVPRKTYGVSAKFIVDLPELSDCTGDPADSKQGNLTLLPDRICLLHADLPLKYLPKCDASPTIQSKSLYAYRQILSPDSASHSCLLCHNKNNMTVHELKNHYSAVHELHSEVKNIKFPEDVIYACLPRETFNTKDDENIILNCPCQYCDSTVLDTLKSMVDHYANNHNNKVSFVEQESVLKMHTLFYCSMCNDVEFSSFKHLNQHMKSEHKMQTYPCRECNFFTREEVRLKSHFKAKHMLNSSNQQAMQCLECSFCNGLLMGKERMNRHIQSTHCIETSKGEFSCLLCHEVAGTCDTIIHHMSKCPSLQRTLQSPHKPHLVAGQSPAIESSPACDHLKSQSTATSTEPPHPSTTVDESKPKNSEIDKLLPECKQDDSTETDCFICGLKLASVASHRLHMAHVHTKWIKRKSELDKLQLLVSHLPSSDELIASGVNAINGFYCPFCELVITVYSLFYLHMSNLHKMRKVFQCKVSTCREIFITASELKEHSELTLHPQKSIIEDTLGAICCHFCDEYFKDRKEFELHHLTDQHNIRVPTCKSYTSGRQEARNYKCKTCHTWFGLTDSFIYHMENESHKHSCPYCGIDFALPSSRRTHIQSHHSDKSDVCEICSVKQGSKERLYPHLVTHGIMFECNACIKVFYQKEQLNCHLETHAPLVSCHWPGCERKVASSSLSLHIKQHRVQANSKCKTCGKVFSSPYLLENHHEVHARAEEKAMQIIQVSKQNNEPIKNGSNGKVKSNCCRLCGETAPSQAELSLHKCRSKRTSSNNVHPSSQPSNKVAASTDPPPAPALVTTSAAAAAAAAPPPASALPVQSSTHSIDISLMDTYLIQNPDGTLVELRVPAGMDFNEALNSLTVAAQPDSSQMFAVADTHPPGVADDKSCIDETIPLDGNPLDNPLVSDGTSGHVTSSCQQLIYITEDNLSAGQPTDSQELVSFHPLNADSLNMLSVATTSSIASVTSDCFRNATPHQLT